LKNSERKHNYKPDRPVSALDIGQIKILGDRVLQKSLRSSRRNLEYGVQKNYMT
jgi:hypothetical protein